MNDYEVHIYNRVTGEQHWLATYNEDSYEYALERAIIELQDEFPHSHLDWNCMRLQS